MVTNRRAFLRGAVAGLGAIALGVKSAIPAKANTITFCPTEGKALDPAYRYTPNGTLELTEISFIDETHPNCRCAPTFPRVEGATAYRIWLGDNSQHSFLVDADGNVLPE